MYEDHLKSCEYCQKGSRGISWKRTDQQTHKPTIFIKSASSYRKESKPTIFVKSASSYGKQKKLTELAAIIKGALYPPISIPVFRTKGASVSEVARRPGPIEREVKPKALGKLVRG